MKAHNQLSPIKHFKDDIPASVVVFLVAMPLCLGIALASGAPLFSGLISGIIGGIVVGALSGSALGVSGPAAGLAIIVLNAITDLGSFDIFLVAVILAGIIQLIMGFAKAGIIAYFFPSSVIHGMLAGIGIIIFLKQIPHAFGYDRDPEGDFGFQQLDGHNTFDELINMTNFISPGVLIISAISLAILIIWNTKLFQNFKFTKLVQGPLVAVVVGIILVKVFEGIPYLTIDKSHLVNVPIPESVSGFFSNFTLPNFTALSNPDVYITAIVIAVVASLETLLCVEASDKQDTLKRVTPTNRELKAQGIGNILAGLIGGLPVTQVIVRSSTNQQSGGKTKTSAIIHGFLLLISIIAIPNILNMIPLGVLAAILLVVGFKLAKPALFKRMYKEGWGQLIPFVVTIIGIVFTDLLMGIAMGVVVAVVIILRNNFKIPFKLLNENLEGVDKIRIELSEDVTFLNKASVLKTLDQIPNDSTVIIDASRTKFMHFDVLEIIENFEINAQSRNIGLTLIDLYKSKDNSPIQHFKLKTK
ncbi:MAG TPA: SulP family inorganic anion transporter [Crocinitomicaceae bacterium]|nr:SulP family inorganic anion transporter [Crocinitomicaceae bacterium]